MPNTPRMTPERRAWIEKLCDLTEPDVLVRSIRELIAELDAVTRERDEALYIPGTWICPTCGFVQEMLEMSATNGAVRPSTEPALPCPNDGEFMHRLTWRQHAKSLMAYIDAHA